MTRGTSADARSLVRYGCDRWETTGSWQIAAAPGTQLTNLCSVPKVIEWMSGRSGFRLMNKRPASCRKKQRSFVRCCSKFPSSFSSFHFFFVLFINKVKVPDWKRRGVIHPALTAVGYVTAKALSISNSHTLKEIFRWYCAGSFESTKMIP